MRIGISDIVKINGAALGINTSEILEELNTVEEGFVFNKPVCFEGQVVNENGILKLEGHLRTEYTVKCVRCLKDVDRDIDIKIRESLINADSNDDTEAYTYEGNFIVIDKALKDNIVLNLPMKQLCMKDCKGLCKKCGIDMNVMECGCTEQDENPRFGVLKDYFK